MTTDERYILRCLELARKGFGTTRHNPLVGSVIVHNDRIIGEGYHIRYGEAHAEVNAINSVMDKSLLPSSTLYVNLEPCSHYGKTPPCSMLIRDHKLKRVVVGASDSNPLVSGKGIALLRESGIDVLTGVLEDECRILNKRFFTFHDKKRPYIVLKWAQSNDGFIDIAREYGQKGYPNWITNMTSRVLVHKWRAEEMAIMAGTNTVETDNPSLTLRYWPGTGPLRVVPDRTLRIPENSSVFKDDAKTLVFTSVRDHPVTTNPEYVHTEEDNFSLPVLMGELYNRKIISVMVEGGSIILNKFIEAGLWDEARIFIGNENFINGIKAPEVKFVPGELIHFHGFRLISISNF